MSTATLQATLKGLRDRVWDEQPINQIGTDKDYVLLHPDTAPDVKPATLDDTNTIWISWTGDNANAGTVASPKRSFLDGGYNSAGDGALQACLDAGFVNICFVEDATQMWVESVNIPKTITLYKYESDDTPILRTCKRTLPNSGNLTDATAVFVDPNHGGTDSGTQANPYQTLQKAIDNVGAKTYIIIFNTGTVGTAGDNVSLVINECIDFTPASKEIHVGIQWDTNWFSAGDSYFLTYNGAINQVLVRSLGSTRGNSGYNTSLISSIERFCALYTARYLMHTTDGINFTDSDVTGAGADTLSCINELGSYIYVGTTTRIRRSSDLVNWSDSTTSVYCTRLMAFNNALYAAIGSSSPYIIKKTTDGTTWTTVTTIYGTSGIGKFCVYNNKLYFAFGSTGYMNLYSIDINDNVQIFSDHPSDWVYIYSIISDGTDLYLSVLTNVDVRIYKFNSNGFELVWSGNSTIYGILSTACLYHDEIYFISNGTGIFLFQDKKSLVKISSTSGAMDAKFKEYVLGASSSVGIYKTSSAQLLISNSSQKIIGMVADGSNGYAYNNIIGNDSTKSGLTLQYCHFHDSNYSAIDSLVDPTIKNCIIHDSKYGLKSITTSGTGASYDKTENLFYNITEDAIEELSNGKMKINHNTFDNCKRGLVIKTASAMNAASEFNNNAFSRCASPIYCDSITITALNNLFPENVSNQGVTLSTTNKTGAADFRNRNMIGQIYPDYRLKIYGILASSLKAYAFDSPGKQIATDSGSFTGYTGTYTYDAGCYLEVRKLASDTFDLSFVIPNYVPSENLIGLTFSNIREYLTASGLYVPGFFGQSNRLNLLWQPESTDEARTVFTLYKILKDSKPGRIFINDALFNDNWDDDFATLSASLQFRTLREGGHFGIASGPASGGNAVWSPSALTLVYSGAGWQPDEFKGWWVQIALQETSSPFLFSQWWFKITENTTDTLTLKNKDSLDLSALSASYDTTSDYVGFVIMAMDVRWKVGDSKYMMSQIMSKAMQMLPGGVEFDLVEA